MALAPISLSIASLVSDNPTTLQPAITLLLAIILSYPACLFYIIALRKLPSLHRSIYFIVTGFLILALAYRENCFHYFICCSFTWSTLKWLPSKLHALVINFLFNLTYLLIGYYLNQLDWTYSITWTIPHCVLCLRLIAFSFDIFDGANKAPDKDVGRHTESAISTLPPFHMFMSYCYFPGTVIVGPIIPYLTYANFIQGTTYNSRAIRISIFRLFGGFLCLAVYYYGSLYWPITYLQSDLFRNAGFWWKLTIIAIIAKLYMYKYVGIWMIAEASCILSGITYDGINFYRHTNVSWSKFELAHTCSEIISSYNISVNQFAFKYIYRRLKFLGNIYFSKLITLLFLSLWHGFASGYYLAFSTEFLMLYFENHLSSCFHALQVKYSFNSDYLKPLIWLAGRINLYFFMGYSFVPFMFLYSDHWFHILSSVHFAGHLFLLGYILISFVLNCFFLKP